jgi:hypothetical protein
MLVNMMLCLEIVGVSKNADANYWQERIMINDHDQSSWCELPSRTLSPTSQSSGLLPSRPPVTHSFLMVSVTIGLHLSTVPLLLQLYGYWYSIVAKLLSDRAGFLCIFMHGVLSGVTPCLSSFRLERQQYWWLRTTAHHDNVVYVALYIFIPWVAHISHIAASCQILKSLLCDCWVFDWSSHLELLRSNIWTL